MPGRPDPPIELDPDRKVQLLIAEFNDRRAEIGNRITAQHMLVSLNITAAGAVAGVVFTRDNPTRELLLLLVPICSALAMLWANHARTVRHIGWYIRYRLRPLIERGEDGPLWRWELDHDTLVDVETGVERQAMKWLTFIVPVMLTFIGPPLFAVLYAFAPMVLNGDAESFLGYGAATAMLSYGAWVLGAALLSGAEPPPKTSSGPRSGSASGPS